MKKILATLLVATMLLSCLTFVGFAADMSAYTIDSFTLNLAANKKGYTDDVTCWYFDTLIAYDTRITDNGDDDSSVYVSNLLTQLDAYSWGNIDEPAVVLQPNDYVGFPIHVQNASTITAYISYDPEVLSPVLDVVAGYLKGVNVVEGKSGIVKTNGATEGDGDITGCIGWVFFKVLDVAIGDEAGKASTTLTLSFGEDGNVGDANATAKSTTLGTPVSMVANLSNMDVKPSEPVEDVYMTESEVVNAATAPVVAASGAVTEGWAGTTNVISGDDKDITAATAYSAVFGTIVVPTGKKVDARGFVLVDAEGVETFYAAKSITDAGQFGIAFFGTEASLAKYKAAPAAMVAGEILYDANDLEDL